MQSRRDSVVPRRGSVMPTGGRRTSVVPAEFRRVSVVDPELIKYRIEMNEKIAALERKVDNSLLKDPSLSEEQVKVILHSFSVMDENGDGRISRREIARAYRLAGFNPTSQEIDDIIKEHDANDDGYIDFQEYFTVMKPKMIELDFEKERLKTAFKVLDSDNDGYITVNELEHALTSSGDRFSDKEIREIINTADTNGDGKIDYEEFIDAEICRKMF